MLQSKYWDEIIRLFNSVPAMTEDDGRKHLYKQRLSSVITHLSLTIAGIPASDVACVTASTTANATTLAA